MDQELFPGAHRARMPGSATQLGVMLPEGTGFYQQKIKFLKEIRVLFPQVRITIFTYSRYWSEFDLFDYYDDVAAVSDDNEDGLKDVVKEWDLDIFIETDLGLTAKPADQDTVAECWTGHFLHRRGLKISDEFTGNIYVKDCTMPSDIDNAIDVLGTVDVGDGELHQSITSQIRAQGPLDQIVLAPWPSGGRDPAWKAPLWEDIGKRLIESGFGVVLAGSAEHHGAATALRSTIGESSVELSIGRASLRQTAIMLGRARGALSAPGIIARLAALAGTPLVVLDSSLQPPHPDPAAKAAAAVSSLRSLLASGPVGA